MIKRVLAVLAVVAAASASFEGFEGDFNGTVQGCKLGTATGCSTSTASGLTNQIMKELNNMGYSFVKLNSQWIHCSSPCVSSLQSVAHNALVSAAKSKVSPLAALQLRKVLNSFSSCTSRFYVNGFV